MSAGLILLGLLAGILSGMAAGGGAVLVPGLVLLFGIQQHRAQGAVLAAFLATQAVAVIGHWRRDNIRWRSAWWMIAAAAAGAVGGALLAARMEPGRLRQLFGWYLIIVGGANWLSFGPRDRVKG